MTHPETQKKTLLPVLWPRSSLFLKGGLAINSFGKTFGSLLPDADRWTLIQPELFWQTAPSCKTTEASNLDVVNGETKPSSDLANGVLDAILKQ